MNMRVVERYVFFLRLVAVFVALSAAVATGTGGEERVARRIGCVSKLQIIGLALQNYHAKYGSFPPACTVDRAGKPMHSWRVLILPYLAQGSLYSQYKLEEPWNSENNRRLAKLTPEVYRCPADTSAAKGSTSYLAVVGPHAAWRKDKALRMSDIKDGVSQTVMLVEVADSGVDWIEPRDLSFDEARAGISTRVAAAGRLSIRSRHTTVVNCGFGDGSVHCLEKKISPTLLRGLLTADGREDVSPFFRREEEYLPSLVD